MSTTTPSTLPLDPQARAEAAWRRGYPLERQLERGWHAGHLRTDPKWTRAGEERDPNPTLDGVTQATYDRYRDEWRLPRQSVKLASEAELERIYRAYWERARCPEIAALAPALAVVHYDSAIQHRIYMQLFQRTVGATPDGHWGPQTRGALERRVAQLGDVKLAHILLDRRRGYYVTLPGWARNGRIWTNRLNDVAARCGLAWRWEDRG